MSLTVTHLLEAAVVAARAEPDESDCIFRTLADPVTAVAVGFARDIPHSRARADRPSERETPLRE
jgi:hypothetical protein